MNVFEDLREGLLGADLLVTGRLVDQGDDPDAGKTPDEDLCLLSDVLLVGRQLARLPRGEIDLAYGGEQFSVVAPCPMTSWKGEVDGAARLRNPWWDEWPDALAS